MNARRKFTFRTSITFAVMAFIFALAALLIAIQVRSLHLATREAASAYMDATSSKVFGRLQSEVSSVVSLLDILATSSSVADTNERSEIGPAIPLFKAALRELPQVDSIYVGFDNGAWLQVRRINELTDEQRERLRATPGAAIAISLVRPTRVPASCRCGGSSKINKATSSPNSICGNTATTLARGPGIATRKQAIGLLISSPYLAFSIGAPVITISTPLRGKVPGILAADLKLDTFSAFVQTQKPGEHGIVWIFDTVGSLLAHPDFPQFVTDTLNAPLPVASSRYRRYSHRGLRKRC